MEMGNGKLVALVAALVALGVSLVGAGTASATRMCIEVPEGTTVLTCPEPGKFSYGVDFVPETHIKGTLTGNATFELTGSGTVTCDESTFTLGLKVNGESKAEAGEGVMTTSFKNSKANCSSTVPGNSEATVTAENLSYDTTQAKYLGVNAPQGEVTVTKSGGASVQIKIVLTKTGTVCIYKPEKTLTANWNNASGGNKSQMVFTNQNFQKVSGAACTTQMRFGATYNLIAENGSKEDIYITQE